jgi:alanine racemase
MKPPTRIELSQDALVHNIAYVRRIAPHCPLYAVVKANAYGHGLSEIVRMAEPLVDGFQVHSVQEFLLVRRESMRPVTILGPIHASEYQSLDEHTSVTVYDRDSFERLVAARKKGCESLRIELACDARHGRLGFLCDDIPWIAEYITAHDVMIDSVYFHFSNLEDTDSIDHAKDQIATAHVFRDTLEAHGITPTFFHSQATGALLLAPLLADTLFSSRIRWGIGLYGLWPSEHIQQYAEKAYSDTLKPVLSLFTWLAHIKEIPAGHPIGYGCTVITKRPTRIGVIPVGYSDGIDRKYSNKGFVVIQGHRIPIVGRIAMNMTILDLTELSIPCAVGDTVEIIGPYLDVTEYATTIDTIHYEAVTRLGAHIPRIIV